MNRQLWFAVVLIACSFIAAVSLYPYMPDEMASHWNAAGDADGHMAKQWGMFLLPVISLGLFFLFIFLPNVDPLGNNIKKFKKYYDGFVLVMVFFFSYIYALTIIWNFGYTFNMTCFIIPIFAVMFFYIGILMENTKQNWFIGIRTPWTLSSRNVWEKTHKRGAALFKLSALIALAGMFFDCALIFLVLPIILSAIYLVFYSYFEFRKEKHK